MTDPDPWGIHYSYIAQHYWWLWLAIVAIIVAAIIVKSIKEFMNGYKNG